MLSMKVLFEIEVETSFDDNVSTFETLKSLLQEDLDDIDGYNINIKKIKKGELNYEEV